MLSTSCSPHNNTMGNPSIKEILQNISTTLIFILPFLTYYQPLERDANNWCLIVAGFCAISYVYPPITWKRPNEYSDDAHLSTKRDKSYLSGSSKKQ